MPMQTHARSGPLIYRHPTWTRIAHWFWAASLFFLLLTGLQIFNAHPALYPGDQSGFAYDNAFLRIGAQGNFADPRGYLELGGRRIDTTGLLGVSGPAESRDFLAFPSWSTIPSRYSLATARVIHFFFAWILVATLLVWLATTLLYRRLGNLVPTLSDLARLPADIADHARLRFHHTRNYNVLQKLAYCGVLFVLLPVMIATGLAMSPAFDALAPWLPELFGGRQGARSVHFAAMALLVLFFVVHMAMILLAGPLNELRSIVTGWYRTDAGDPS